VGRKVHAEGWSRETKVRERERERERERGERERENHGHNKASPFAVANAWKKRSKQQAREGDGRAAGREKERSVERIMRV